MLFAKRPLPNAPCPTPLAQRPLPNAPCLTPLPPPQLDGNEATATAAVEAEEPDFFEEIHTIPNYMDDEEAAARLSREHQS